MITGRPRKHAEAHLREIMREERPASVKVRRQCFEYWRYQTEHGWRMKCAACGSEINPACDIWHADHLIVHAHGGSDEPPNVRPMHQFCHQAKTKKDVAFIAKGKRQSDSIYGVRRPSSSLKKREGLKYNWARGRYFKAGEERE